MYTDTQIGIYLDSPKGQIMQVSYSEFKSYWALIGWHILQQVPTLPGFEVKPQPLQDRMI
jgi:hypothetical protein